MKKKKPSSKIDAFKNNLAVAKAERDMPSVGVVARLAIHEAKIERILSSIDASWVEIGKELYEIQAESDFAETTFEAYVKNRWSKSRDWAYKMIDGYKVKAELPANVENLIQTQSQARALKEAPKEKRAEVIKEVVKSGKPTAKKIAEVIESKKAKPEEAEFRVVIKDFNDEEVPEEIAEEFTRSRDETKDIRSKLNEVRRWLEDEQVFKAELSRTDATQSVKDVIAMVAVCSGDYVCPICKGKKCKVCSKRGFVSKMFYNQKISGDKK